MKEQRLKELKEENEEKEQAQQPALLVCILCVAALGIAVWPILEHHERKSESKAKIKCVVLVLSIILTLL